MRQRPEQPRFGPSATFPEKGSVPTSPQGGDLYKHCRFQLKHRMKPVGKYMPIKNMVGIEKRPVEADGTRFGDWEMDLMVGAGGKGAMVTLVERSTSYSMIRNLPLGKNAKGVADAVIDMLLPFKRCGA